MKTLVIAPQPFFSPRGTPFSVYYRTMISSELGVKMDFLTYGEGQNVEIPNVRFIRVPRFKFLGNVKIGPSPLKLFLDIFIFAKMFWLLLTNKYDVVHAHEEAVFMAYFLKPIFKFKLIYDMHSSLTQQLTNFQFTTNKAIINIFKTLEDNCLHTAEAVITICPDLRDYVNTIITNKEKHFLIENSIFDPVKRKNVVETNTEEKIDFNIDEFVKDDEQLLVYAGTLEKYQGIDILVDSMKHVIEENKKVRLLIAGGTKEQVDKFSKHANSLGLENNVKFTGRVAQKFAKEFTAKADILLSPRSDGTNTPLKIYEQLASGKALVATRIYSHTQVLTEEVCFLVDPNPEAMAKGILLSLSDKELAQEKVKNAMKLYEDEYSRTVYTSKLKRLLESL
ncbi:MAG: glycosyltransferase [Ignavibacteriae bacterium]|nr:glycosyltransferase [Ignavibacteriota bacterium]MCB9207944.1 glycosyltransferase [Ignavibacteriales bacterium]MCB9258713.1 glycosyltransferase [Ignavibacteriales bacterium]